MGRKENIKNYYIQKRIKENTQENAILKTIQFRKIDNTHKAFSNCYKRAKDFKGDVDEFKAQIEKSFIDGMTWDNYGEWEIDHITPLTKGGRHEINNFQALWKTDNRIKGNRINAAKAAAEI